MRRYLHINLNDRSIETDELEGEAVVRAGTDFVAVAAGVWNHGGGAARAVADFNAVFDELTPEEDDPPANG